MSDGSKSIILLRRLRLWNNMSPLASMLEGIDDVEKGFANKKASGRKAFRI